MSFRRAAVYAMILLVGCAGRPSNAGAGSENPEAQGQVSGSSAASGSSSLAPGPDAFAVCATPTFQPGSGAIAPGTMVTLTAAGLPANGFIYYTTDQTMPTHASAFVASGGTVTVSQSETLTAVAYAMGTCSDSTVATATYTVQDIDVGCCGGDPLACGAPTFNPPAGAINLGSTVTIVPPANFPATFPQGNAVIYYTVDGTIPTHASPAYSGPIQINASQTIHAFAYDPGVCADSTIALASFTIEAPCACCDPLQGCGAPLPVTFNPPSATQSNDFLVQLTDDDPAATICFTYGTGAPTCTVTTSAATCSGTSQTYNAGSGLGNTGSVTINSGVTSATTGTVTVNAIACTVGGLTIAPAAQTYTLKAAAPTMQGPAPSATLPYLAAPGYAPTITSATAGSTVRYTTDGSTPTCATGTLLAMNPGAVPPFTGNSIFNAIACKAGYAPSPIGGPFIYGIIPPSLDGAAPADGGAADAPSE
jgi:hypothetical protein